MDDQSVRILKIEKYPFTASLVDSPVKGEGLFRYWFRYLISDALPFGRLWDGEPNAIGNAVAQRNQITRKLAISKFANWILCFCHIRLLAMGRFN